jgi:hypothetical protein
LEVERDVFVLQKEILRGEGEESPLIVPDDSDPKPHYFCTDECVIDYLNDNCPSEDLKHDAKSEPDILVEGPKNS